MKKDVQNRSDCGDVGYIFSQLNWVFLRLEMNKMREIERRLYWCGGREVEESERVEEGAPPKELLPLAPFHHSQ